MPSCGDYVLHFLTLFWKILFAFVPPTGDFQYWFILKFNFNCLSPPPNLWRHVKTWLIKLLRRSAAGANRIDWNHTPPRPYLIVELNISFFFFLSVCGFNQPENENFFQKIRHVGRLRGICRFNRLDRCIDGRPWRLVITYGLHCRSQRFRYGHRLCGFGYQHPR